MYERNGFDYGFDYDYDYSFDYTYGNRKGPHKQSLIVKCFVTFKTRIFFIF